jgi:hypothetical protein
LFEEINLMLNTHLSSPYCIIAYLFLFFSMSYHQFSQVYKTWSNLELFQLLQNKNDYQEEAVEAATAEINSRGLSQTELEILQEQFQQSESAKQTIRQNSLAKRLEEKKGKIIADLNPLAVKTTEKNVRLLCYSIALIIFYNFIGDYRMISTMIMQGHFNSFTVLLLMPYLFVPIGIYSFWKKQKFGWSIIAIWLALSAVMIITGYIWELRISDDNVLNRFFPKRGLNHYLLLLFIFGGLLFYVNTKKITELFNIDKKFQLQIGIIAGFFALLYTLTAFF